MKKSVKKDKRIISILNKKCVILYSGYEMRKGFFDCQAIYTML